MTQTPGCLDLPTYRPPGFLFNGHLQTIYPSLFRRLKLPAYRRERIKTEDGDFLDLDWLQQGVKRLVIISHGLEGDSRRSYVVGMAHAFESARWDVLAWNFRGCSGEINLRPRFTHNGATDDLHAVVQHALETGRYTEIALVGFSMGGNLSLVYLGRDHERVPDAVMGAALFSVPCDLSSAAHCLARPENRFYMQRFMRLMGTKVFALARTFPEQFPVSDYSSLTTFQHFDERYTAPLHGFNGAAHYWQECSGRQYLPVIKVPTWIVNAVNDPFLSPECSPRQLVEKNPLVRLLQPESGGHCGFPLWNLSGRYWSEVIAPLLLEVSL